MKLKRGNFCPLIQDDCKGIECVWFTQMRGTNTNTGQEEDEWGCAVTWLPFLLVETSAKQKSTTAAIESFRNEMVESNEQSRKIMEDWSQPMLENK